MPVPQDTPTRSGRAAATSSPLAASACAAAPSANCETRSRLAASPSFSSGAALHRTVAPTWTPELRAISAGSRPIAGRPSASARRNSSSVLPSGETTPIPVTATRRIAILGAALRLAGGGERGSDVALEVGERLDALQLVVGDRDAEFFLDLEHELDEAEGVDAE